jgi:dihydrofolate reductase
MIVSHIAAISKNRAIGRNNQLPWHLPADTLYFKNTTLGHVVIMGRKNFEAEGKALPQRTNIVVTRNEGFQAQGCIAVNTIDEALKKAKALDEKEVFIIGGGEIYKQTLHLADRLYITIIDMETEGDVFYPEVNWDNWRTISFRHYEKDSNNPFDHDYYIYERKR